MENVLIVSENEGIYDFLSQILLEYGIKETVLSKTSEEARNKIANKNFDLYIINSPLRDESGLKLAKLAVKSAQVIFIVKEDVFSEVFLKTKEFGIVIVSKPLKKTILANTIQIAISNYFRNKIFEEEFKVLSEKIETIRIVDRAKCILIEYLKMTEEEAHKYIEKSAMDLRLSKKVVARDILKTYEGHMYLY